MYSLYDTIYNLCQQQNITAGKMCNDLGFSRGMMSDLKMGRKQTLAAETLAKIAEYFGVTVDFILGSGRKPDPQEDLGLIEDEFIAFYGEVKKDLDEADIADLKTFMRMKAEIKRKSEKKG